MDTRLLVATIASFLTVILVTPFIIRIARLLNATDKPNHRKVHDKVMPRWGGIGIFAGVLVGYFLSGLYHIQLTGIIIGAVLILIIGVLDDKYTLSAKAKLLGQFCAAVIVASTGLNVDLITIPLIGQFQLGSLDFIATIVWIITITNIINLIDGLDGLAAGVSVIITSTIAFIAGTHGHMLIVAMSVILIGSTLGFLVYNFHPAKIFMGDAGSLFLGYSISIISLLGLYKSVTLFSFVVPIIILGVPVFDTLYAIVRRIANRKPIAAPDKGHLHHRLLKMGFSHQATVLMIYALSIIFSAAAVLFQATSLWGSITIVIALILMVEIIAEFIGLVSHRYKPILNLYEKIITTITYGLEKNKH
ncbi:MraY family glycosyltransferase [Fictibacillus sp. Mic-4]|uniref:glycosyltransferase family 4 protein n=1 Tax=Fictibacillus TaxID=1329200 RepID=UPI000414ED3D|nr:MraY family glycosyltransferase [Fictibacillus gelatini]